MSYQMTLEKAGATILGFKEIGSYQGTWGAIVEYGGKKGLVTGYYGSCSGCDSFQAQFDYGSDEPMEKDGKYYRTPYEWQGDDNIITKEEYDILVAEINEKYAEFGRGYLHTVMDQQDIETKLASFLPDDYFDSEEKELYDWALTFFQ